MILLIIGFIFLLIGLVLFYKANQIKIIKNNEQEQYKQKLEKEVHNLQIDRNNLINSEINKKEELNRDLLQWQEYRKKEIEEYVESQQQLADKTVNALYEQAQKQISDINNDIQNTRNVALQKKEQIQTEIDTLKASLAAGVQARLREQQKKEKLDFYKLSINKTDLDDVMILENLKPSLHKPVILSKLIWTQYFQKQMTELCDRVLGKNIVCGIYKITDTLTEQCYIGQSVNISDRWKQHCKCGLGIEASATNKLYNAMQKDGVWNFTFELLEQCPKELLNEKESFWIEMYQSNTFGYNITKGNKQQ